MTENLHDRRCSKEQFVAYLQNIGISEEEYEQIKENAKIEKLKIELKYLKQAIKYFDF